MVNIPSHNPSDFLDKESISLVENFLAQHKRVMPRLSACDRWPNVDGSLELQDRTGNLVGKMEAQVKTLPKNHNLKFDCPVEFFSYCEVIATWPVIFLCVDNENKIIYWVHFSKDFIKNSGFKDNAATKRVELNPNQVITQTNKNYVSEWESIVDNFRKKNQAEAIASTTAKNVYKKAGSVLKLSEAQVKNIQLFLDKFNSLLDGNFSTIKSFTSPKTWKFGLAYNEYTSDTVSYHLYQIPAGKNDVQIKEIDQNLLEEINSSGFGLASHYMENPFEKRPEQYAMELVEAKTLKILNARGLKHENTPFLIKEYAMSFIDKFHIQMGLEEKDEYDISEIKTGFKTYLPLWIDEVLKEPKIFVGNGYVDPNMLLSQCFDDKCKEIAEKVKKRMAEKDYKTKSFVLGNNNFPMGIFAEFLKTLQDKGIDKIGRIYIKKDFERLKKTKVSWIWNCYSLADLEKNLNIFFENLASEYDRLVAENFPNLKKPLSFFDDFDFLLVTFEAKETYETKDTGPSIETFDLKNSTEQEQNIKLYRKGSTEIKGDPATNLGGFIEVEHVKYRITGYSCGNLRFIYDDFPMFNYVYEFLKNRLKKYFENLEKA